MKVSVWTLFAVTFIAGCSNGDPTNPVVGVWIIDVDATIDEVWSQDPAELVRMYGQAAKTRSEELKETDRVSFKHLADVTTCDVKQDGTVVLAFGKTVKQGTWKFEGETFVVVMPSSLPTTNIDFKNGILRTSLGESRFVMKRR